MLMFASSRVPAGPSQIALARPGLQRATQGSPHHHHARRLNQRIVTVRGKDAEGEGNVDAVNDLLDKAEALMAEVGVIQAEATKVDTSTSSENPRVALHCDVNGCTIAPVVDEASASKGPPGTKFSGEDEQSSEKDLMVMEGKGWKMGFDRFPRAGDRYNGFIGGDDWTITLTSEEYQDFIQLLKNLRQSVATLEVCGEWDKEDTAEATLEMSTPRIWMQGRAPQRRLSVLQRLWSSRPVDGESLPGVAFSLRFIVTSSGSREVEGFWPASAVMAVLEALDSKSSLGGQDDDDTEVGVQDEVLLGATE
ncbi:hypothetical protein BSKO_08140 [Bryopsis sp. KO-2023]|nr:hypothetical protein BSKO_08140 [Bryopsis sp. KO-2023]